MRATSLSLVLFTAGVVGCNTKVNPFAPVPECEGATVTPFRGDRQLVLSSLAIADFGEGFDLDLDGKVDNKLATLGALANSQIDTSFKSGYDIVIPFELFGYDGQANGDCVKTAFYLGSFNKDADKDGKNTSPDGSDCLDNDPNVRPGKPEDLTNRLDDDCDGFADNMIKGSKPADMMDMDGDGFSLNAGDCDDRADAEHIDLAKSRHPGAVEICGDGIDQNCDGIPDNDPKCNPFAQNAVTIDVTAMSFNAMNAPQIQFKSGKVAGAQLDDGPSLFKVSVPIQGRELNLELSGARLRMKLSDNIASRQTNAKDGILAGVLQAVTLAQITNINAGGFIKPDQSLLDAIFVGPVAPVLGLDTDKDGNYVPDIDVDGDGLETFYQTGSTTGGASAKVDTCKDGDGTIITSTPTAPCTLAKDENGNYRFVDGLSVALKFTAVPVKLSGNIIK